MFDQICSVLRKQTGRNDLKGLFDLRENFVLSNRMLRSLLVDVMLVRIRFSDGLGGTLFNNVMVCIDLEWKLIGVGWW